MSEMVACPQTASWVVTAAVSVGTFLLGLLVPRFWMSKKERKDVDQANYQNTERLLAKHEEAYRTYTNAIVAYQADGGATKTSFVKVAQAGDDYFRQARFTCDAIMEDKVAHHHRDSTLIPHFKRITATTLPEHYEFLVRESGLHGYDYRGELRREDHQSIFSVVEKFGGGPAVAADFEPLPSPEARPLDD